MNSKRLHLLVNLPAGFFAVPSLAPVFARLEALGEVRRTSCNAADEILPHLAWADAVLMWSWPGLTHELLDQCPRLRFCTHLDIQQENARVLLQRGLPVSLGRRGFSPAAARLVATARARSKALAGGHCRAAAAAAAEVEAEEVTGAARPRL